MDLDAPDDLLIAQFREWLKKSRNVKGIKGSQYLVTNTTLNSWVEYRILEYIDINLFCQANHRSITLSTIGEILFPGEEVDTTERVRKVVKPMATRILEGSFVNSFGEQTARAEQKEAQSRSGT